MQSGDNDVVLSSNTFQTLTNDQAANLVSPNIHRADNVNLSVPRISFGADQ